MSLPNSQVAINDPFESAENPSLPSPEIWGLLNLDAYFVYVNKGEPKVKFDPQVHDVAKRKTAVDYLVSPLAAMNSQKSPFRSIVAEFDKGWYKHTLPSIKALGLNMTGINGKYVRASYEKTGETYKDNGSGETRDSMAMVFVKVFANEAECLADYQASKGGPAAPGTQYSTPVNGAGNDKERETALQFLKVLVENSARGQTDLTVVRNTLAAQIASMPLVNKFFTVDSPETANLIAKGMAK